MDFTIAGQNYRSGKMDTFIQLHVASRLMPILGNLKEAYASGSTDFMTGLEAAAKFISAMADADREYVVKACFDVTQRQQGAAWAPLRAGGRMMFEDIDLQTMMQITWQVLQERFSPFFSGPQGLASLGAASA